MNSSIHSLNLFANPSFAKATLLFTKLGYKDPTYKELKKFIAAPSMVNTYCNIALRLLRLLAFCVTFSAAIIMFTSHETPNLAPFYKIDFSDLPSFKYFAYTNLFIGVYSFLVAFLPQDSLLWRLVVAVDVVATMLLTSTSSAALTVAYLGKRGNFHANWRPICSKVPIFCDHVIGAISSGFVGVAIYMVLLLFSIHVVLNPLLVQAA